MWAPVCSGVSEPLDLRGADLAEELRTSERDDGRGGRGVSRVSRWALGLGSAIRHGSLVAAPVRGRGPRAPAAASYSAVPAKGYSCIL